MVFNMSNSGSETIQLKLRLSGEEASVFRQAMARYTAVVGELTATSFARQMIYQRSKQLVDTPQRLESFA